MKSAEAELNTLEKILQKWWLFHTQKNLFEHWSDDDEYGKTFQLLDGTFLIHRFVLRFMDGFIFFSYVSVLGF